MASTQWGEGAVSRHDAGEEALHPRRKKKMHGDTGASEEASRNVEQSGDVVAAGHGDSNTQPKRKKKRRNQQHG